MRFFNKVTLQTPESVELEFTLAGIGNRAYAVLIDYTCLAFILIGVLIFWIFLATQLVNVLENLAGGYNRLQLWLWAIYFLVSFFIYVGYFIFFETLWQGQTPGKRFVKIRVVADDARPVRLQQSTLRALLRPIDELLFLGLFLIALNKREKRLGDLVAGTLVVQEEQEINPKNLQVSEPAQKLADRLQVEADIFHLQPEDFGVIREYLQRREGMLPEARTELSRKLGKQVKEIIGLEKVPEGTTANLFLEAVYLAYQQQPKE